MINSGFQAKEQALSCSKSINLKKLTESCGLSNLTCALEKTSGRKNPSLIFVFQTSLQPRLTLKQEFLSLAERFIEGLSTVR